MDTLGNILLGIGVVVATITFACRVDAENGMELTKRDEATVPRTFRTMNFC